MPLDAWLVLGFLFTILFVLVWSRLSPDFVLLGGLTVIVSFPVLEGDQWKMGLLRPEEAFSGFSNTGMLTVAVLFIVVAGLRETGAIDGVASRWLGTPTTARSALARLTLPVAALNAFLNNTPIVAMLVPAVGTVPLAGTQVRG